jgi:hypothetical protein
LTGSLDDSDVRRVLTYVVKNGERFNSGVRLDCLDALKARSQDKEVRSALLEAARKDQNPAVRLKALEALRDSTGEGSVREALLEALQHDSNPGGPRGDSSCRGRPRAAHVLPIRGML